MQGLGTHPRARSRAIAALLALLYGLIAGIAVVPAAAATGGPVSIEILGRQPAIAIAAGGGKHFAKAKRAAPQPLLATPDCTQVFRCGLHPHVTGGERAGIGVASFTGSPYCARAPPAV